MTHICVGKPTIIGSDNGFSPERLGAIIWTNAGILLYGPLGTNFSEILIEIQTFSLTKIRLEMSSAKCCSFRRGLNVLRHNWVIKDCWFSHMVGLDTFATGTLAWFSGDLWPDCSAGDINGPRVLYIQYRKTSSISRTKSQNLTVSCIVLRFSPLNPLKPGVKLRMEM